MTGRLKRFLASRGVRKFRRDRLAMVSLVVIAAYLLLAGWISLANAMNDHVASIDRRPLLGLLLRSSTAERVGPNTTPGFGLTQPPLKQFEHDMFWIERAAAAVDQLQQTQDPLAIERIRTGASVAERRLSDLPTEGLRELLTRADAIVPAVLDLRSRRSDARTALVFKDRLPDVEQRAIEAAHDVVQLRRAIDNPKQDADDPPEDLEPALARAHDRLETALDELSLSIEDVTFRLEAYAQLADDDDPIAALDLAPLLDAAEAVLDLEPEQAAAGGLYPRQLIEDLVAAATLAVDALDGQIGEGTQLLRPIVQELFPMPTGAEGMVYKFKLMLGTDRQGRSIIVRALYSAKIAVQVGVVTAIVAVFIGGILGAAAAYFGGFVDHAVNWLYSVFTSIPSLVLLVLLSFMFLDTKVDSTLIPLYAAFSLTYWIGPCRVIRGEAMKIKELEYVQAATAIGFGRPYILVRHIIPNTAHLMFINFSLLFIAAIKGEVILTFLGLGLKDGASWGIMISQSKHEVVNDFFWQIGGATFFMFVLVLAFNIFTDALQDAFDPKHVG